MPAREEKSRGFLVPLVVVGCAALGTVLLIGGLRSCGNRSTPIAVLSSIASGSAEKSIKNAGWTSAGPGDGFRSSDAVRTSSAGAARLTFHNGAVLRLGPETTLRFGRRLSLSGEIQNESAAATTLALAGEQNEVKLEAGAKIRIATDSGTSSILVLVGSAIVTTAEGAVALSVGDSISMQIGAGAVSRLPDLDAGPRALDASVPIDAAVPAAASMTVTVSRGVRVVESEGAKARELPAGDHELAAGAVITLSQRRSSATFARGGERAEMKGKGTATLGGASGRGLISVARGRVAVIGGDVATTISVPGGTITARAASGGSEIDVVVGSKSTVAPKIGRAEVESKKAREVIQIGEKIELQRSGDIAVLGRQPKVADFSVRAGDSASVHDPGAPTAVRIRFEDKCDDGVVEWGSRRASRPVRGSGSAITLLNRGSHSYQVRCYESGALKEPVASGRISIDANTGTKRLPDKPPVNVLDATGGGYEIFYQNYIPYFKLRWPNAKATGRYKLHVKRSEASAKVYTTDGASHVVKDLREGSYRFWFEGDGTRSKESLLTIKFDNAATTGYLRRPRVGESWSGGQVPVEGAGISGTRISVNGVALELDSQTRFKAEVSKPGSEDAIAIKFVVPRQGTHYYIRRNGRR